MGPSLIGDGNLLFSEGDMLSFTWLPSLIGDGNTPTTVTSAAGNGEER